MFLGWACQLLEAHDPAREKERGNNNVKLKIKDCKAVALHVYPGEQGTTQVLEVSGLLTPSLADKLQVRSASYTEEGIPHNFDSYASPSLRVDGADIALGEKEFRASLLHKFKVVKPKSKKEQGVALELSVRIHFGGKEPVKSWLDKQNGDTFLLNVSARQEDLAFGEREAEDEPEQEDPAALDVEDKWCTSCNANNPMGLAGYHINGQKCTNPEKDSQPEPHGPALASARVAAGGTHQKKEGRRNQPPRDRGREALADGSATDEPVN